MTGVPERIREMFVPTAAATAKIGVPAASKS
jgi:hypothetical protein